MDAVTVNCPNQVVRPNSVQCSDVAYRLASAVHHGPVIAERAFVVRDAGDRFVAAVYSMIWIENMLGVSTTRSSV